MEMAGLRFQDPWWLLTLCGALAVLLAQRWRQALAPAVLFPSAGLLAGGLARGRVRWRSLPLLCAVVGLALCSIALARPQQGSVYESVSTRGVDVIVALDISGSMAAEDFQPRNRLTVAKEVVGEFVRRRRSDRVGLVIFAARSLTKAPPTTDQALLLRQLEDVQLNMLPDGTAIGSGLATALTRLRRSKATSRVIVLVTDGGNNAGEIDPATATDLARAMQVRVYTIGVGREGPVPMPVRAQDPFTGAVVQRSVPMEVKFDEPLLRRIAERTGADYFRASDPAALRAVFAQIDRLEKSEIKQHSFHRYRELFAPLLTAAAVFFALGGLLRLAGLRVAPV
jgi:Ca-activated chloride channel family protein